MSHACREAQNVLPVGPKGLGSTFTEACIDGALFLRMCMFMDELLLPSSESPITFSLELEHFLGFIHP